MQTVNKVILVGKIGADPDVRKNGAGQTVAHFSIATERWEDLPDGDQRKRTDWHRVTLTGNLAEKIGREIRRHDRVYVDGRIQYGSYERENTSIPITDIIANDLLIISRVGVMPGHGES